MGDNSNFPAVRASLIRRIQKRAAHAQQQRKEEIITQLAETLPDDVQVQNDEDGIKLSARNLRYRRVVNAALRWLF